MDTTTTVRVLAARFVAELRYILTPAEFAEVRRRNATPEYEESRSCASHDFCDANMVMLGAFEEVVGREPAFLQGTDEKGDYTLGQLADQTLWNAAWERAVATELSDAS